VQKMSELTANPQSEAEAWSRVTSRFEDRVVELGLHWSHNLYSDPKRLAFVLSRYKFAGRLATRGKRVLELGCSEGLGALVLGESAASYTGIDLDAEAIATARRNLRDEKYTFIEGNFLRRRLGCFDTVVSLDVVEHIERDIEHQFFEACYHNLGEDGVCLVGTPNITSAPYASRASQIGHVNLFDGPRLQGTLQKYFHNVFLFGLNDEVLHTGFTPMTHYLMVLAVYKRKEIAA
jgi:2-polyprenyl-3-methyl-5-hydroxy-6-metoxy-1,4-benzoquinol methylase